MLFQNNNLPFINDSPRFKDIQSEENSFEGYLQLKHLPVLITEI